MRTNGLSKYYIPVIILIVLTVTSVGCSSGFVPAGKEADQATASPTATSARNPANGLVQSSDAGAVIIDLKWEGEKNNSLVFSVSMNTHSVDLDRYDLSKLATLRDDAANEYLPISWQAPAGGHHRSGTLTFPLPASLSQGNIRYIEILIRDVADIPQRVLRWEL